MTRHAQAGTGTVASTVSVAVFLSFVLLAAHTLVQLHATSTLSAVGMHATRSVAADDVPHDDSAAMAAAMARAEATARSSLGRLAQRVTFGWHVTSPGLVRLRLTVHLPGVVAGWGSKTVDRWFSARVESPT